MSNKEFRRRPGNAIKVVTVIVWAGLLLVSQNGLADPSHLDWNNPWEPTDPFPKFFTVNFININDMEKISRFRSGAGHIYTDKYEAPDRSMKHYFMPLPHYRLAQGTDHSLRVYAPVAGTVVKITDDIWDSIFGLGSRQIRIVPDGYPMFEVRLFHTNNFDTLVVGSHVSAGQWIGWVDMKEADNTDLTVDCIYEAAPSYPRPERPEGLPADRGIKYLSAFDVMDDALLAQYQARGIADRSELAFTKEYRDAHPVTDWEQVHPEDWVTLVESLAVRVFLPSAVKYE